MVFESNPVRRLTFEVCPEVDPAKTQDRQILVGEDVWNSGALIVIPLEVASDDCSYIDAIMDSRTVGEVRQDARAWAVAAERYDSGREDNEYWDQPGSEELTSDHPYDPNTWFGDEGLIYVLPLARLRTAETAPRCLDALARKDTGVGMDYEPAAWWSVEDVTEVKDRLVSHGYEVVEDDKLISRYSNY